MTRLDGTDGRLPARIDSYEPGDLDMAWGKKSDSPVPLTPIRTRSPVTGCRVILVALIIAVAIAFAAYLLGHASGREQQQVAFRGTITTLLNSADEAADSADYWRGAAIDASATADALESDLASLTAEWQRQAQEPAPTVIPQKAAPKPRPPVQTSMEATGTWQTAKASWYGPECFGNNTANGTPYTPEAWGVAHKSLPFGTMVEITYNGQAVTAPVFDRGPFVAGRTFDLSAAVARALGFSGVQTIKYRVVS